MWARVSRYQFPAAEVERVIEHFGAGAEEIEKQPGLKRVDVFVSRKSGAGMTISVWESLEAMKASDEKAEQLREAIALELIGWIQSVDEYELVRTDAL
jgi:heme-degrading monooxygenase HmoA